MIDYLITIQKNLLSSLSSRTLIRLLAPVLLLILLTQTSYAQYYRLSESNTGYAYFSYQEIRMEFLLNSDIVHKKLQLSPEGDLSVEDLLRTTNEIRNKLSDGYSVESFESLSLENSLGSTPLEERHTHFYLHDDSTVTYLLQTRIIFAGNDREVEKFGPKIKAFQILQGADITMFSKAQIHEAFYHDELDDLSNDLYEGLRDIPPPPPPPTESTRYPLSNSLNLVTKTVFGKLSIDIPDVLESNTEFLVETENIRILFKQKICLTVTKLDKRDFDMHLQRNANTHKLKGIKVHRDDTFELNGVRATLFEATYFDNTSTWTKILIDDESGKYAITLRYPEKDRLGSTELREKMLQSITLTK